jgi:L-lactate dehydrogenase complex protein LldE
MSGDSQRPRVGLYVTCLVDLMRPSVGFSAVRLLEAAGCEVCVPAAQTCCGQPAYNSGDRATAKTLALKTIAAFAGPLLMAGDDQAESRARAFAEKVYELVSFLADVRKLTSLPGQPAGRVAYHDACSGLRELGIKRQPRALLAALPGTEVVELADAETCCGFGGLFCMKYPGISNAIVSRKTAAIAAAGPDVLLAGDLGCLLNIAGKLAREGSRIPCRHVAEVLAGEMSAPAIAAPPERAP